MLVCVHPELSQRPMTEKLGLMPGKAHYLVKVLIASGWVKTHRFVDAEHKTGYIYVLTSAGIVQRFRLANNLLERKRLEFERLEAEVAQLENRIEQ